jgi:hypothetical protein
MRDGQEHTVNKVNTEQINALIQGNYQFTMQDLAKIFGISIGSTETIIHDELNFSKVALLGSKFHNQRTKGNTIQHLNSRSWTALKGKVANFCTNSHMQ